MPDHITHRPFLASHINGQCDCACPDGSYPGQPTSGPLIAYFEITSACNGGCAGCPNTYTFHRRALYQPTVLRLSQWELIISRLLPHLRRVKLTGGEPTLHPDFPEIIAMLDDIGMPFDLFTNGIWLNPQRLTRLLSEVKQFGGCLISLHGPTADSHEAFNGVLGSFEKTVRNIRLATTEGIPVVLSTVITSKNFFLIDDLLALGERIGVSHIVFNRYIGFPCPEISPTRSQLVQAVRCIDHRRAEGYRVKFSVCIPQCFVSSSSWGCVAGTAACTIDPFGNMRPCNHAPLVVGNLLRQDLSDLWNSESMEKWRALPERCFGCSIYSMCGGGCRVQAMLSGGQYDPLMMQAPRGPVLAEDENRMIDTSLVERVL